MNACCQMRNKYFTSTVPHIIYIASPFVPIQMMNKPLYMQINNEDSEAFSSLLTFFLLLYVLLTLNHLLPNCHYILYIFALYRMIVIPNTERDYIIIQTHNTLRDKHSHVHIGKRGLKWRIYKKICGFKWNGWVGGWR